MKIIEGTLPANDLRRAFVDGAKWWNYYSTGFTMFQEERNIAEREADERYASMATHLQLARELIAALTNNGQLSPRLMTPEERQKFLNGLFETSSLLKE